MFTEKDIISTYTRKEALADGFQVDMNTGDLAKITRGYFKFPIYISRGLHDLMEKAVANKKWHNDRRGVWHDICSMGKLRIQVDRTGDTILHYKVIITGTGKVRNHVLRMEIGATDIDNPAPCIHIGLYGEE